MNSNTPEPTVYFSLTVKDSAKALDFYHQAFGAQELFRMPLPDGGIAHAEFMIGNTKIYLSDEAESHHAFAMPEGTMASCVFSIEIHDCDQSHAQAVAAGAKSLVEPRNECWGARYAIVLDPFGYRWGLSQKVADVSPEEMMEQMKNA
jgi:PhnB protein